MRWLLLTMMMVVIGAEAAPNSEVFIITINDRSMAVICPEKSRPFYAVIVENRSLSNQIGKFIVGGKPVKFVSIPAGKSETVEFENKSAEAVYFIPVSPAFQEVELKFGKKAYEIPPKK